MSMIQIHPIIYLQIKKESLEEDFQSLDSNGELLYHRGL